MLVAEARRVLLEALRKLGAGLPDQDALGHGNAAERLRDLREWSASALCRLRFGCTDILLFRLTSSCTPLRWIGIAEEQHFNMRGNGNMHTDSCVDCICRDLRVIPPIHGLDNAAESVGKPDNLCGGYSAPCYLSGDACIATHEKQHTPSLLGEELPLLSSHERFVDTQSA